MEPFNIDVFYSRDNGDIKYRSKNEYNQTLEMIFYKTKYIGKVLWEICLQVSTKRNEFKYLEQPGKGGLYNLAWAKYVLVEFINSELDNSKDNVIVIRWDDSRRRRVYERYLKDLGFQYTIYNKLPSLVLKINKNS